MQYLGDALHAVRRAVVQRHLSACARHGEHGDGRSVGGAGEACAVLCGRPLEVEHGVDVVRARHLIQRRGEAAQQHTSRSDAKRPLGGGGQTVRAQQALAAAE